jgi:hypothetical protein
MKTRALVMAGVMALTIFATTRVAQAQQSMAVNVPFDFVAGNKTLPAGEYTVKISTPTHSLILVSRKDSTASAFINTNAAVSSRIEAHFQPLRRPLFSLAGLATRLCSGPPAHEVLAREGIGLNRES